MPDAVAILVTPPAGVVAGEQALRFVIDDGDGTPGGRRSSSILTVSEPLIESWSKSVTL